MCYCTVKPVVSGHSKMDKKILMTNGSSMKVKSIGEMLILSELAVLHRFIVLNKLEDKR